MDSNLCNTLYFSVFVNLCLFPFSVKVRAIITVKLISPMSYILYIYTYIYYVYIYNFLLPVSFPLDCSVEANLGESKSDSATCWRDSFNETLVAPRPLQRILVTGQSQRADKVMRLLTRNVHCFKKLDFHHLPLLLFTLLPGERHSFSPL